MVPGLNDKSCQDRLKEVQLPSLTYSRLRGDMIEVFKLVNDVYYFDNKDIVKFREESITRSKWEKTLSRGLDWMLENIAFATE